MVARTEKRQEGHEEVLVVIRFLVREGTRYLFRTLGYLGNKEGRAAVLSPNKVACPPLISVLLIGGRLTLQLL